MKKILGFLIFTIVALYFPDSILAQCNTDAYNDESIGTIQSKGYTFVKSYKLDGNGGAKTKIEYSYVFSKDTEYLFSIHGQDGEAQGVVISLYDSNRKFILTNRDKASGKFYPAVNFPCKITGIYYMTYTFEESKSFCAACVVGFKR